jgi:hypothetical protein
MGLAEPDLGRAVAFQKAVAPWVRRRGPALGFAPGPRIANALSVTYGSLPRTRSVADRARFKALQPTEDLLLMNVTVRTFLLVTIAGSLSAATAVVTQPTVAKMITDSEPAAATAADWQWQKLSQQKFQPQTGALRKPSSIEQISFEREASDGDSLGNSDAQNNWELSRIIGADGNSPGSSFPAFFSAADSQRVVSPSTPGPPFTPPGPPPTIPPRGFNPPGPPFTPPGLSSNRSGSH